MPRARRLRRPAWFKGEVAGRQVEVGTGKPPGSVLVQWFTDVDGDRTWHPTFWEAHAYINEIEDDA